MNIEKVTFFGYADSQPSDPDYQATFESARLLANDGYTIVNGGGPGLMQAASEGAKVANGKTIGVTLYPEEGGSLPLFEGRTEANEIDEEIKTTTYLERTLTLIEQGDVFVIMKGGTGTISEFGMAWGLARLHFGHHKHLILYGSWWHTIIEAFGAHMFLRPEDLKVYHIVDSPIEVLQKVQAIESLE